MFNPGEAIGNTFVIPFRIEDLPLSQLPYYGEDILEGYYYNNKFYTTSEHTAEISGASGKIFIDIPSNETYRWIGNGYAGLDNVDAISNSDIDALFI